MKQASKRTSTTNTKPAAKKSSATERSKKIVASKKKFSLSPLQKKFGIIIAVIMLVSGLAATYALYQNMNVEASSCKNKVLNVGSRSICTRYFLNVAKARGKNKYTDANGKPVTVAPGNIFGPKTSKVAKANGLGTSISGGDWKTICKWAANAKRSSDFKDMGCKGILKITDANTSSICTALGYNWRSGGCHTANAPAAGSSTKTTSNEATKCNNRSGYHWELVANRGYSCVEGPSYKTITKKEDCKYWHYYWNVSVCEL